MRWQEGLCRMGMFQCLGERLWDVFHNKIKEGALFFLHEEGIVEAYYILMLQLLQDIQLPILVLLILQDVLHGEELPRALLPNLPHQKGTR